MNKRTKLLGAVVVPAVVLALAVAVVQAFPGGSASDSTATTARHDEIAANAQQVTVTVGDSLSFDQPSLVLEAGRPVVVTVRNTGATEHDFVIPSLPAQDVVVRYAGGHSHGDGSVIAAHPKTRGEVRVQFTPTQPGTYQFYCSLPGHKDAGMTGTITVL